MTEARTERVASREFRGTRVSRMPGADSLRLATRREGTTLVVSVAREDGCVVSSTEVRMVDVHVTQTPGGTGFLAEAVCVGLSVPVAALYLPNHDSDPLSLGSGRTAGVVAAGAALVCGVAAGYDMARAHDRDEHRTVEAPVAPTPVPCGPARAGALAEVVFRARNGGEMRATADARGEAAFPSAPAGEVEVALEGLSARLAVDEAHLTGSWGTPRGSGA